MRSRAQARTRAHGTDSPVRAARGPSAAPEHHATSAPRPAPSDPDAAPLNPPQSSATRRVPKHCNGMGCDTRSRRGACQMLFLLIPTRTAFIMRLLCVCVSECECAFIVVVVGGASATDTRSHKPNATTAPSTHVRRSGGPLVGRAIRPANWVA